MMDDKGCDPQLLNLIIPQNGQTRVARGMSSSVQTGHFHPSPGFAAPHMPHVISFSSLWSVHLLQLQNASSLGCLIGLLGGDGSN